MRRVFCFETHFQTALPGVCRCAGASAGRVQLFQKDGADANAESGVSIYGKVSDFDYENFDYSAGLDENGYWSGVKALDHVKLPEDAAAIRCPKQRCSLPVRERSRLRSTICCG